MCMVTCGSAAESPAGPVTSRDWPGQDLVFRVGRSFGIGAAGRVAVAGGLIARLTVVTAGPVDAGGNPLFQFFYIELNLLFHLFHVLWLVGAQLTS